MGKAEIKYPPNNYRELWRDGALIMSDATRAGGDYAKLIGKASGDVLMIGLGLGSANEAFEYEKIDTVDVLELHQDIIDLCEGFPKTNFILGDAKTYKTDKLYDVIWIDIWRNMNHILLPEMYKMIDLWKGNLKPGGWVECYSR
ncbi:MAG: hypothetical protein JXR03_20890 [Cyclobacteriaceae bacterium]